MIPFLYLILILFITKELIVINDETIINLTFLTLTIIIVHYGSFLNNVFESLRKSIIIQLQTNSKNLNDYEHVLCDRSSNFKELFINSSTPLDYDE